MNRPIRFICNQHEVEVLASPGKTALDFIRNDLALTGTKEGCREGECGACIILLGEPAEGENSLRYRAVNSCLLPLGELQHRHAVTIEGINPEIPDGERPFMKALNPIQRCFVEEGATQCGFCTPGFIIALTWFFLESGDLSLEAALDAVSGNICRCTGYGAIRRSIQNILDTYRASLLAGENRIEALIEHRFLPPYFRTVSEKLRKRYLPEVQESAAVGTPGPEVPHTKYIVAGGTDILVQRPEMLLDAPIELLSVRKETHGIHIEDDTVRIGAAVPMEDLLNSELLTRTIPRLNQYLHRIAASPIRQRATLGGNIVNGSPIGDMSVLLLALKGFLVLMPDHGGSSQTRTVELKNFFRGYKDTDLRRNEIVRQVCFPVPKATALDNFEKVSRRTYLDIASVNSAIQLDIGRFPVIADVSVSAGGVAPVPFYLKETSELLEGRTLSADLIRRAANTAGKEITPISDIRGSAEYKRKLLKRLILAHFITLFPDDLSWEELR